MVTTGWHRVGRDSGCCPTSCNAQGSTQNEDDLAQNVTSAEAEKPCFEKTSLGKEPGGRSKCTWWQVPWQEKRFGQVSQTLRWVAQPPPPPSASHPFLDPLLSNTRQTVLGNEMQENLLDEAPDKIPLGRYLPLSVLPAWTVNPPPGGELATFSAMRTRIHY